MKSWANIVHLAVSLLLAVILRPALAWAQEAQPDVKALPIDELHRVRQEQNLGKDLVRGMNMKWSRYSTARPYAVLIAKSPHPVRNGKASLRLELQTGDCGRAGNRLQFDDCKSRKDRIELVSEVPLIHRNTRGQYGWSLYLPNDFELHDRTPPDIYFVQFHEVAEYPAVKYPTDFVLGYGKGDFSPFGYAPGLVVRRNVDLDPAYDEWKVRTAVPEDELRGRWHDFKVDAYWRSKKDGYFRLFVDDKLVYDCKGPTIQGQTAFLKIGIYRFNVLTGQSPTTIMYVDDVWRK